MKTKWKGENGHKIAFLFTCLLFTCFLPLKVLNHFRVRVFLIISFCNLSYGGALTEY